MIKPPKVYAIWLIRLEKATKAWRVQAANNQLFIAKAVEINVPSCTVIDDNYSYIRAEGWLQMKNERAIINGKEKKDQKEKDL